jgi:hypothetical protein
VVLGHATTSVAGIFDDTLVWTWDGTEWSTAYAPTPDTALMHVFYSVQCTTVTDCVAAGQEAAPDGSTVPALERWDGTSFTWLSPPSPGGMIFASLGALSCVSRDHCVALGLGYTAHDAPITSFLDVWNGRTWKLTEWRGPKGARNAELSAVSCASATDCVAVGSDGPDTAQHAAALTWDGATWTAAAVPGPGPGRSHAGQPDGRRAGRGPLERQRLAADSRTLSPPSRERVRCSA